MHNLASEPLRPTRVRHIILWLTVAAYMITYMDRVVISASVPSIQKEFGFSDEAMSWILGAFRWGYAFFQIPVGGWLGDLIGPRKALALVVLWWSLFTSLTAVCWSALSMVVVRFLFGVGEAGAFPIATRSLSRWMLPTERGYAQGVTHAGSRIGAAITPPIVVSIILAYGWRAAFVIFGLAGMLWSAVWYFYYRDTPEEHASVNRAELELIRSRVRATPKGRQAIPWRAILASGNLWTLSAMYFCYGYCLAVYLDWFPKYLNAHRGFDLKQMGFYASLPLLAGTAGDLLGGWLSDRIGHRTGNIRLARKLVATSGFLLAAAAILPATFTANPYACVWYTCLALFGLEVTVGVSWAVPLDIGGDFAGTVSSVMNTCGNIGGAISTTALGYIVAAYGWDRPFVVAAGACLAAAVLFLRVDAGKEILCRGKS